jgi:predicted Zn finger-like uncharacterized protein
MIVVCPACTARFQYDEARFQGVASKRFKCPKCAHVFEVKNPLAGLPEPASHDFSAPAPDPTVTIAEEPFRTVPLPPDQSGGVAPTDESPTQANVRTTARRDREAMLTAAGLAGPGMPADKRFSLAFLSGPQASTAQVLDKPIMLVGREEGDVITRDPETSRRHASLEIHSDGTVWLMDLDSTNGTFVDGQRISGKVELQNTQEFTCGNSTFMLMIRNLTDFELN